MPIRFLSKRSGPRFRARALVAASSFLWLGRPAFAQPAHDEPREPPPEVPKAPAEPPRAGELKTEAEPNTSSATAKKPAGVAAPEEAEAKTALLFAGDIGFTRGMLGVAPHDLGFSKTAANGALYGLLAGVRLEGLRLGLRWRVHDTTEFSLWTFAASAGYQFSSRPLTPIVSAHLGYVFDERVQPGLFRASIPLGNVVTPDVDLRGMIGGLEVAGAYWVSSAVRVGAFVGLDAMFLFRPKVAPPQSLFGPTPDYDKLPLYSESGTTLALNFNVGLRGEFDIALH